MDDADNPTQDTELGPVPADWSVGRLEELVSLLQYGTSQRCHETPKGLPVLRIPNVIGGSINADDLKYADLGDAEADKYRLQIGDLLFVRSNGQKEYIGRCAAYEGTPPGALFASYLIRGRVRSEAVDYEFFRHYAASSAGRSFLSGRASNAADGKFNLNTQILRDVLVPLPSIKEQRDIAHVLRITEQAKDATAKVVTATRQLKESLVRHLFTYGPVPVGRADRVPLRETEVGPVPAHWKVVKLVELLREPLRNGHSAKATNTNQGIRTLTLTAVTRNDFAAENTKLTTADPVRVRGMWLKAGDILVERANTPEYVGLAALYEGADDFAIYPDLMIRVRVKEDQVRPKYLAEFLLTNPCRTYYRSNAKATAGNFPKIDQGVIEATTVPIAPGDEQQDIEVAIRAVDQKITREQARFNSLDAMFKTLLHTLMTGKVRVEAEAP